ncbi:hypothetical protein EUTSA_v100179461mg, partial [Eutrema salsugineum]
VFHKWMPPEAASSINIHRVYVAAFCFLNS